MKPTNPMQNPKQGEVTQDAIDALLDAHMAGPSDELTPSSGFALSVMESIHTQMNEVSPISFPWRRVVPGVIAVLCGLVALIVFAVRSVGAGATSGQVTQPSVHLALAFKPPFSPGEVVVGWIVLAAGISLAAIAASFRLAGGSK